MKFRQALKIIKHNSKYRGYYRYTPPWYMKACQVVVRHFKRDPKKRRHYEVTGLINKKGEIIV